MRFLLSLAKDIGITTKDRGRSTKCKIRRRADNKAVHCTTLHRQKCGVFEGTDNQFLWSARPLAHVEASVLCSEVTKRNFYINWQK